MTADYPRSAQTRITVRSTDGSSFEALQKVPKGNAGNPLDDFELEQKLRSLYSAKKGSDQVDRLLEVAWPLERCGNVGALVDAIGMFE
jgi:2-methylcitrate dehydratase PrpD